MNDLDHRVLEYLYNSTQDLKVGDLAQALKCPHTTMGSCIKRLKKIGLVIYEPYRYVSLTSAGKEKAIELIRHAQLLEVLFHEALDLNAEEAHNEAQKVNYLLSCEIINKICEKFNHPKQCPCGETILNSQNCYCQNWKKK